MTALAPVRGPQEAVRGWAEVVADELARFVESQTAAARRAKPPPGPMESAAGTFAGRDPEPAEPVPDDASWLAYPDDDRAWEADAGGHPEPHDRVGGDELPAELDPEVGD